MYGFVRQVLDREHSLYPNRTAEEAIEDGRTAAADLLEDLEAVRGKSLTPGEINDLVEQAGLVLSRLWIARSLSASGLHTPLAATG